MGCLLDIARSRRYKKVGLQRYALSTKKYSLKNVKNFSSFLSWVQQVESSQFHCLRSRSHNTHEEGKPVPSGCSH